MIDFSDKHEYQRKPRCMEHIITNIIQSINVLSQKLIPKDFSGNGWLEIPLSLFDRTMIPKVCFNMFHLNGKILLASHKIHTILRCFSCSGISETYIKNLHPAGVLVEFVPYHALA